jgi:hypothetical protein
MCTLSLSFSVCMYVWYTCMDMRYIYNLLCTYIHIWQMSIAVDVHDHTTHTHTHKHTHTHTHVWQISMAVDDDVRETISATTRKYGDFRHPNIVQYL